MSWFKAIFGQGEEGSRHWTRLKFSRSLKQSQLSISFERRLSALGATIHADWKQAGFECYSLHQCIIEGAPLAVKNDHAAGDLLEEYLLCRRGLCNRIEWLQYELNAGLRELLTSESPLFDDIKVAVATSYRETGALWEDWLDDQNHALIDKISKRVIDEPSS